MVRSVDKKEGQGVSFAFLRERTSGLQLVEKSEERTTDLESVDAEDWKNCSRFGRIDELVTVPSEAEKGKGRGKKGASAREV